MAEMSFADKRLFCMFADLIGTADLGARVDTRFLPTGRYTTLTFGEIAPITPNPGGAIWSKNPKPRSREIIVPRFVCSYATINNRQ
jgi:hypothetical protein